MENKTSETVAKMLSIASNLNHSAETSATEIKSLLKELPIKERRLVYRSWYETIVRIKELVGNEKYWNK